MRQGPVVFFLSAGRCGTQWLAETLRRRYRDPEAILEVAEVARHLERIAAAPRHVETGWPAFPALPLLAKRFAGRLRIVHLTRHPVPSAMSHAVHSSCAGSGRDDEYTRLATLAPTDRNVFQPS